MRYFLTLSLFLVLSFSSHADPGVTLRLDSANYHSVTWHGDITSSVSSPGYHLKTCHGAVKIRMRSTNSYILPLTTKSSYKASVAEAAAYDCEAGLASQESSLFDALESIWHEEIREKMDSVTVNGQAVNTRSCYRNVVTLSISAKTKIDGFPALLGYRVRQLPVACP